MDERLRQNTRSRCGPSCAGTHGRPASVIWARTLIFCTVVVLVAACAGPKKPVLYPNAHLQSVGKQAAAADIDDCEKLANDYGLPADQSGEVGSRAAKGAAIGGVSAGAWGLIRGDAGSRAVAGAAAGGAAGATSGALESGNPDPIFQRFVERCLSEKGYSVIGWR